MQLIPLIRPTNFLLALRVACMLVAAAAFGACDQHSAEDVPENYGHGSSHQRAIPDHQVDSRQGTQSFSDTAGTRDEQSGNARETPAGSASPTPANHFY